MKDVRALVRRHPIRGFDAIHLSAALWLRAELGQRIEFWASDQRHEAAAKREHIAVAVGAERSIRGRPGPGRGSDGRLASGT